MKKKDLRTIKESDNKDFVLDSVGIPLESVKEKDKIFPERLTKEHVKSLPIISFRGTIHLIDKKKDIEEAIKILSKERVLGFDTETRPNFKKGQKNSVSLLQLSTQNDAYLLAI